jgi:glycosyltransferase involved in cell wall biosynthesis
MTSPAVSVFITFHAPSAQLFEAIESVLAQTFADFELLLVHDGDPIANAALLERYPDSRIRLVHETLDGRGEEVGRQLRMMTCRNRGLREAAAPLLMLLDGDDVAEPDRLESQVAFLRNNSDHVLVGSSLTLIDGDSRPIGTRLYPVSDEEIRKKMLELNCIAQSSVTIRRRAALDAGGYGPRVHFAEDYDLWLRMLAKGRFHNLPALLTRYRIHPTQGKATITWLQLRDTLAAKLRGATRYGLPWTTRAVVVFLLQIPLLALPPRLVYWLFRRVALRAWSAPAEGNDHVARQ